MTTNVRRAGHIDRFKLRVKQLSRSSFSTSSLDFSASAASAENCRGGKRGLSLAASGKILTNIAVNWRARSVQAKNERRERRATKTLAIVLGTTLSGGRVLYTLILYFPGCFLFCWIPFFTCNTLNAISIKWEIPEIRPSMDVFLITTWLGYVNSIVNPFIYTIFNREFRKAFKKIFKVKDWSSPSFSSQS